MDKCDCLFAVDGVGAGGGVITASSGEVLKTKAQAIRLALKPSHEKSGPPSVPETDDMNTCFAAPHTCNFQRTHRD